MALILINIVIVRYIHEENLIVLYYKTMQTKILKINKYYTNHTFNVKRPRR